MTGVHDTAASSSQEELCSAGRDEGDIFSSVRQRLCQESQLWVISHLDITCDGCECEPITGSRQVCRCADLNMCQYNLALLLPDSM